MGQLAAGLENQWRYLRIDALDPDAVGGPGNGERPDHRAGVIANRHGNRRDVFEKLARLDGEAVARHRVELLEQYRAVHDSAVGETRELLRQTRGELLLAVARQ